MKAFRRSNKSKQDATEPLLESLKGHGRKRSMKWDWQQRDSELMPMRKRQNRNVPTLEESHDGSIQPSNSYIKQQPSSDDWSGVGITACVMKETRETETGISFLRLNRVVVVSNILQDGLFSKTELRIGDEVVRVNNVDCSTRSSEGVAKLIADATGPITVIGKRNFYVGFDYTKRKPRQHLAKSTLRGLSPTSADEDAIGKRDEKEDTRLQEPETREEASAKPSFNFEFDSSKLHESQRFHYSEQKSRNRSSTKPKPKIPFHFGKKKEESEDVLPSPKNQTSPRRKFLPKMRFPQRRKKQPKAPPEEKEITLRITEEKITPCDDGVDGSLKGTKRSIKEVVVLKHPNPGYHQGGRKKKRRRTEKKKKPKAVPPSFQGSNREDPASFSGAEDVYIPTIIKVTTSKGTTDAPSCVSRMTETTGVSTSNSMYNPQMAEKRVEDTATKDNQDTILRQLFHIGCKIEDSIFGEIDDETL